MPTTIGLEFTKIFNFDGSSTYTDVTLKHNLQRGQHSVFLIPLPIIFTWATMKDSIWLSLMWILQGV